MKRIVTAEEGYPIQPHHIDATRHLFDAFGNMETEISAGWIIRFAQERGTGWQPFTQDDIDTFYNRKFSGHFGFNGLISDRLGKVVGEDWIALQGGQYHFTHDFIARCHLSSPAKKEAAKAGEGNLLDRFRFEDEKNA